jgi:hypothetical protein
MPVSSSRLWLAALATVASLLQTREALALGEIFKVDTNGTEYCGDFDSSKFTPKTDVDLWGRVDSTEQLTLSFTPTFDEGTTWPMFGFTYQTGRGRSAFVGGVVFDDGAYVTMQGNATWDQRTGAIKSLSGTFIQNGLLDLGCFSSGKFSTKKP